MLDSPWHTAPEGLQVATQWRVRFRQYGKDFAYSRYFIDPDAAYAAAQELRADPEVVWVRLSSRPVGRWDDVEVRA